MPGVETVNVPDVVNVWYLYPSPGVVSVPPDRTAHDDAAATNRGTLVNTPI